MCRIAIGVLIRRAVTLDNSQDQRVFLIRWRNLSCRRPAADTQPVCARVRRPRATTSRIRSTSGLMRIAHKTMADRWRWLQLGKAPISWKKEGRKDAEDES